MDESQEWLLILHYSTLPGFNVLALQVALMVHDNLFIGFEFDMSLVFCAHTQQCNFMFCCPSRACQLFNLVLSGNPQINSCLFMHADYCQGILCALKIYLVVILILVLQLQKHIQRCDICKSGKTCYQSLQVSLHYPPSVSPVLL